MRRLATLALLVGLASCHRAPEHGKVGFPVFPNGPPVSSGGCLPSTTSTATIQALINAMPSTGGDVYLCAGDFTMSAEITIPTNNVRVHGQGLATRLIFNASTSPTFIAMADTTARQGFELSDLTLSSVTFGTGLAIDMSHFQVSHLNHIKIDRVNQGVDLNSSDTFYNNLENLWIVTGSSGSFGVRIQNGANANIINTARIAGDANMYGVIVDAYANRLYQVDVESLAAVGIDVRAGGHTTTIFSPYLELLTVDLQLASGVMDVNVVGGEIKDGGDLTGVANIVDNGAINFKNTARMQRAATPLTFTNIGSFSAGGAGAGGSDSTTTPHPVILLDQPPLTVANTWRDSDSIILRGRGTPDGTTQNLVEWRSYIGVTGATGTSAWHFQARTNTSAMQDKFVVDGSSLLTLGNGSPPTGGRILMGGSIKPGFVKMTSSSNNNRTIGYSTDCVIVMDSTGGVVTATLPAASGFGGTSFKFKRINTGANNCVITPGGTGPDTIDGASGNYNLTTQWAEVTLTSDNVSGWLITASH